MIAQLAFRLIICAAAATAVPVSDEVCAPLQSTAALHGWIAQVAEKELRFLSSRAMVYVDYTRRMEAFNQTISIADLSENIMIITDYNENKSYEIYPHLKICTVRDVMDASRFKRPCIGDGDMKLIDSLEIGGRMADVFVMTFLNTTLQTTVMRDDFTPISSIIEQNYHSIEQTIAYQYGNVSASIDDPSVFNLPSYCSGERQEEVKEAVNVVGRKQRPLEVKGKTSSVKRVCRVDQWENVAVGQLVELINGMPIVRTQKIRQAVDYSEGLEALFSELYNKGLLIRLNVIRDWNQGLFYQYNPDTKTCRALPPPTKPLTRLCTDSKEAQLLESMVVDGKMADIYRVNATTTLTEYLTVFRDTLEPISVVNNEKSRFIPLVQALQIGNFTTVIADRSVFDIPKYCQK